MLMGGRKPEPLCLLSGSSELQREDSKGKQMDSCLSSHDRQGHLYSWRDWVGWRLLLLTKPGLEWFLLLGKAPRLWDGILLAYHFNHSLETVQEGALFCLAGHRTSESGSPVGRHAQRE